jgi:hypothetical protein
MEKIALLVQELPEKKRKTSIFRKTKNEKFIVKGLPNQDLTEWILNDDPVILEKILGESIL